MTTTTNTSNIPTPKVVTKIVTFYSDGTFSEYSPALPAPSPMPINPYIVPYQPWWQGPVSYSGQPIPCSQGWGVPTEGKTE